jgi:hypothetical protein
MLSNIKFLTCCSHSLKQKLSPKRYKSLNLENSLGMALFSVLMGLLRAGYFKGVPPKTSSSIFMRLSAIRELRTPTNL